MATVGLGILGAELSAVRPYGCLSKLNFSTAHTPAYLLNTELAEKKIEAFG